MAQSTSSLQVLGLVVGVVVACSGWLWGLKFKNVAEGDTLAVDEKILIQLQDQIDALTEENRKLAEQLHRLSKESNAGESTQ